MFVAEHGDVVEGLRTVGVLVEIEAEVSGCAVDERLEVVVGEAGSLLCESLVFVGLEEEERRVEDDEKGFFFLFD